VFTLTAAITVLPLKKVTAPVGFPLEAVTVAVMATSWFALEGLGEVVSTVVVEADEEVTTCDRDGLVLPESLVSPEYVATMEYVPAVAKEVVHVAAPDVTVAVPQPVMVVPLEVKPTVPVAVEGVMVAVKVTD
jgi:hypothetical protein